MPAWFREETKMSMPETCAEALGDGLGCGGNDRSELGHFRPAPSSTTTTAANLTWRLSKASGTNYTVLDVARCHLTGKPTAILLDTHLTLIEIG